MAGGRWSVESNHPMTRSFNHPMAITRLGVPLPPPPSLMESAG